MLKVTICVMNLCDWQQAIYRRWELYCWLLMLPNICSLVAYVSRSISVKGSFPFHHFFAKILRGLMLQSTKEHPAIFRAVIAFPELSVTAGVVQTTSGCHPPFIYSSACVVMAWNQMPATCCRRNSTGLETRMFSGLGVGSASKKTRL